MKILTVLFLLIGVPMIYRHFSEQYAQACATSTRGQAQESIAAPIANIPQSTTYPIVQGSLSENRQVIALSSGDIYHRMKNEELDERIIGSASQIRDLYLESVPMGTTIAFTNGTKQYLVIKESHDNQKVGFSAFRHD